MALNAKANPNYVPKRINGKFAPGYSGNPGGSLEGTRRSFNKDFLLALAADFKKHGAAAIEKVRKQQPAAYMKICALLVPREMKLEHSGGVKAMTDEQIERGIELIKGMLAERDAARKAKVIEAVAEPVGDLSQRILSASKRTRKPPSVAPMLPQDDVASDKSNDDNDLTD